jgi:hypothetical protein
MNVQRRTPVKKNANEKAMQNIDVLLSALKERDAVKEPVKESEIERNEDGKFAANPLGLGEESAHFLEDAYKVEYTFASIFPNKSVDWENIRNFILSPEDVFERVMGIAMLVGIVAMFNPIFHFGMAYASNNFLSGAFALFIIGCLLVCILFMKVSFPFVIIAVLVPGKLFFIEGRGDFFIACAMALTVYLMFRIRKRREEELDAAITEAIVKRQLEEVDSETSPPNQEKRESDN